MDGQDLSGFEGTDTGNGQGLAYVLPQSRSVGYFMQLANEKAQQARDNAAALQAQQQKANEDYANHLYQFKTPEIANEYTKWLQPKFDNLLQQASQYHTQTGGDPFTNPAFVQQTNDLNTVAKSTHQANLRATALATQLADKSKNFTPDSQQAATSWLQNYYKDPVSNLYTAPPSLQERNLDLNDAVKLGHPIPTKNTIGGYNVIAPDRHAHIVQGQQILSQPEFAPYLQSNGINPTVGDIGGIPNGTGGTIYPTDAPSVNSISDHILQNAQQPHYAQTLQAAGIDPLDPHAKDKLADLVTRQNAGYGKVYSNFADRLDAAVPDQGKVRNTADEGLAIREMGLSLRERGLEDREAAKKAKGDAAIDPQPVSSIPYATATEDDNGNSTGFNINARNFVPVKSSDVPFGANPDIDLTNGGKPQGITPLSKFSIAGVGDFPLYKNSQGKIQAGTPVSDKTEDYNNKYGQVNYKRMVVLEGEDANKNKVNYLMDYNKIPANVKNAKSFSEAVAKFDQTPVYGTQQQQPQSGTISYNVNGTQYSIPAEKSAAFLKQFPNAKQQ